MHFSRRIFGVLLAVCACACGEGQTPTQVVVWIGADDSIRDAIERVEIEREAEGKVYPALAADWTRDLKLVLTPAAADAGRRFTLKVRARDGGDSEVASIALRSGYVANQVRHVRLILTARCVGQTLTREPERLGRSRGRSPELRACAAAQVDLPDAGTTDAREPDGGPDEDDAGAMPVRPVMPAADAGGPAAADSGDASPPDGSAPPNACDRPDNPCEDVCVPSSDGAYFRCACSEGGLVKTNDFNACWHWQKPVQIEHGSGDVELSHMDMNPDGVAIAAWFVKVGAERELWAARFTPGSGWQPPMQIIGGDPTVVSGLLPSRNGPGVSVDNAGNGYVVWHDHVESNVMTMRVVMLPADAPDTSIALPTPGTPLGWSTMLKRNPQGGIFLATSGGASFTEPTWWLMPFSRGAGWGSMITVAQPAQKFTGMRFAVGETGKLSFVFSHEDGTTWGSELMPDPPYSPETSMIRASSRSSGDFDLDVAIDSQGNSVALWLQAAPEELLVNELYWSETYGEATSWFDARRRATDVAGFQSNPRVVFDGTRRPTIVWVQIEGQSSRVYAAPNHTPTMIDRDDTGYSHYHDVAGDALGNVFVVWARTVAERANVWVNRLEGSRWGGARLIEEDDRGNAGRPSVRVDKHGNAMVIWEQSNGSRVELWSRRFD